MEARDLMTSPVVTVKPDATVGAAARLMLDNDASVLPVVDDAGKLVGILSHADFGLHPRYRSTTSNVYTLLGSLTSPKHLEEVSRKVSSKPVREVMQRRVFTVNADAPVSRVAELMTQNHIHRMPVIQDGQIVGIITRHDFLKLIVSD